MNNEYLLIYDGDCAFCSNLINILIKIQSKRYQLLTKIYVTSGSRLKDYEYKEKIISLGFPVDLKKVSKLTKYTLILVHSDGVVSIRSRGVVTLFSITRPSILSKTIVVMMNNCPFLEIALDLVYRIFSIFRYIISRAILSLSNNRERCLISRNQGMFIIL